MQPVLGIMRSLFLFLQIEATGRGKESSTMVVAITIHPGVVTGTISMSSTGTRTTIMGTGDTWTPTVQGTTDPTTCPERDRMTSTAVTATTGDTGIIMTGMQRALRHQALTSARGCLFIGGETSHRNFMHLSIRCSFFPCARRGPKSGAVFLPSRHLQNVGEKS